MIDSRDTWTIWICVDCMQALANGELRDDAGREPSSALDADAEVTCGLVASEHECDSLDDCNGECERQEFSWSRCDGCGSRAPIIHLYNPAGVPLASEAIEPYRAPSADTLDVLPASAEMG